MSRGQRPSEQRGLRAPGVRAARGARDQHGHRSSVGPRPPTYHVGTQITRAVRPRVVRSATRRCPVCVRHGQTSMTAAHRAYAAAARSLSSESWRSSPVAHRRGKVPVEVSPARSAPLHCFSSWLTRLHGSSASSVSGVGRQCPRAGSATHSASDYCYRLREAATSRVRMISVPRAERICTSSIVARANLCQRFGTQFNRGQVGGECADQRSARAAVPLLAQPRSR